MADGSSVPPSERGEEPLKRMQPVNFEEALELIVAKDARYSREAYLFLREALDHTQKGLSKANKGKVRHVSGQELLAGIKAYALAQYGPMTITLLHEWGVKQCSDFGEIVFTLVEHGVLSKTDNDSRADFQTGYDFEDAFRKPFIPGQRSAPTPAPG